MRIERFEDLVAWQRARELVCGVYRILASGAGSKDFEYRSQIRRAAVSVMTNIAEGFARSSRVELRRFLDIARSSAREVQSLLYIGRDLAYLGEEDFGTLYAQAGITATIISKLMASLKI